MAGITESRTWNDLLTTTLANYSKKMRDQIFDVYPLLSYLNGKLGRLMGVNGGSGSALRMLNGGESIVEHLLYELNSTVKSYAGAETIDTTLQDGMTIARYNWKQIAGTVGITGLDKRSNNGEQAMINLLTSKIEQLEMTFRDNMNRQCFSDGTGNGSKDITGLQAIISDTGTLAGIDSSTYTWWQSKGTTTASFATNGIDDMRTTFNDCTYGNDKPDLILTHQTPFEYYEKSMQPQERFVNTKLADAGFQNLQFKGTSVLFDRDCPVTLMYFLNSKYLKFCCHSDAYMKLSAFVEPENQDVTTAKMIWQGNLTTNNRRKLGVNTISGA